MTLILISLLPFVLAVFYYIKMSLTGEFDYLWNSREIFEEDIQ